MMRSLPRALVGLAVLGLLLTGCGGGDDAGQGQSTVEPTSLSADAIQCEGTPREGVALDPQAQACADNGFEFAADEFSFANWGGPGGLDATGMVAMFGPDAVCADQSNDSCTLFPAAQAWLDQVNQAMAGGRCEGMAVVAARLEEGGEPVTQLQQDALVTLDLRQESAPVVEEIEYCGQRRWCPRSPIRRRRFVHCSPVRSSPRWSRV